MAVGSTQIYSAPFDAIAEHYDDTFTASKIGLAQRGSVWRELERVFRPGERILEIGCGTGVDACFLAERCVKVVACDNSPQMISVATRRVREGENSGFVEPYLLAAEDIGSLRGRGLYDGAFSNFGALNCVANLRQFALDLSTLLKPGATALLCWMGPCCLWEVVWYLAQFKPGKAFRRLRGGGITARLAQGATIRVQYPSVRQLARTFAPEFRLVSLTGIGVVVPPSYLETWARRFPGVFDFTVRADSQLRRCPGARVLADHILLEFRRDSPRG